MLTPPSGVNTTSRESELVVRKHGQQCNLILQHHVLASWRHVEPKLSLMLKHLELLFQCSLHANVPDDSSECASMPDNTLNQALLFQQGCLYEKQARSPVWASTEEQAPRKAFIEKRA
eukprot:scaffold36496_cov19-Tisochrysis_lutea.AAC.1